MSFYYARQVRRSTAFTTIALALALAGCAGPGCVTEKDAGHARLNSAPAKPRPVTPVMHPDIDSDACASQLQDIGGALLLYSKLHDGRLPEKLEDLKELGSLGTSLKFTCPASNQPYVYVPAGLIAPSPGDPRPLVVYDALPAHNGARWGLIMGNNSSDIKLLTDRALQTYIGTSR